MSVRIQALIIAEHHRALLSILMPRSMYPCAAQSGSVLPSHVLGFLARPSYMFLLLVSPSFGGRDTATLVTSTACDY